MWIPHTLMLAVCGLGPEMTAEGAVAAIARGVRATGAPEPDACPIQTLMPSEGAPARGEALGDVLAGLDFDTRMRRARAVIVGAERLDRETLRGSAVFEIATRARQAGVPAYAVSTANKLDAFDARMLDLQVVLQATASPRGLAAAGRKLARLA